MNGRRGGNWVTSGLGFRLAAAAAVSGLLWLAFFWATGAGGGA